MSSFILYEPSGVQDILAGLSRQVKAVAFSVSYATDDGMSYSQNALWGASDILHKVAASMDDLAELPLPSLDELGSDIEIAKVAQVRMKGRVAEDLLFRIRQLGQFRRAELSDVLQQAFRSMTDLERQLIELDADTLDDRCRDILKALRFTCSDSVTNLEASLAELRRLNDAVAGISSVVDEIHQSNE